MAILSRYGKINERVLAASRKLKVIGRHGVGMDAIDQASAKQLGIKAIAAVGSNSHAVAERALRHYRLVGSAPALIGRRITRLRISVMSSIAKRTPSRPRPESLTPP
ncbi:MAG TPA: hypothetical protein DD666_01055 [Advenella kashmirensis]|uniref:D-isomer specific 2-hydroxyacid dehydrogenase catalytic domain-containing protein n=1 Tax=Advenella kashmirensis TaxID=310575 RepID=A0A356LB54_9BURK|nr:hypothetical protein [Advenella kashmirensis]